MRVATYNIASGFNASSLFKSLLGHFSINTLKSFRLVKTRSRFIDQALDLACSVSPNILCLNEILPSLHADRINGKLPELGFNIIGLKISLKDPLQKNTILALKEKSEEILFRLPYAPMGRNAAAYIPSKNLIVIGVHLNVFSKPRGVQIQAIKTFVDGQFALGRRVILLGDFNCSLEELKNLGIIGTSAPTNLYSWFLRWLTNFAKDLDHIILFNRDFTFSNIQTHKGHSDHMLLYCDLEEVK